MDFSLFLDFDGTVASTDVGRSFFTTFSDGRNIPLVKRWAKREISSVECLTGEAELISASRDELIEFSRQFDLDPGFGELYSLCRSEGVPVHIVSDGLDIYIKTILRKHGFDQVPVLANRAVFDNGHLSIEFPHLSSTCEHCANCKGAAIRKLVRDGDRSIFVGDGYSDLCAVSVADYLFAKADLADYLRKSGEEFLAYETLNDVSNRIREIFHETLTARHMEPPGKG